MRRVDLAESDCWLRLDEDGVFVLLMARTGQVGKRQERGATRIQFKHLLLKILSKTSSQTVKEDVLCFQLSVHEILYIHMLGIVDHLADKRWRQG